jgi:hypothetical protein
LHGAPFQKIDQAHNYFSFSSFILYRIEGMSMKTSFGFDHLSREERQAIEQLLLEEMERQQWGSVTYSVLLSEELILSLQ